MIRSTDTKESSNQSEEKGSDDKEGAKADGKDTDNKVWCSICLFFLVLSSSLPATDDLCVSVHLCSDVATFLPLIPSLKRRYEVKYRRSCDFVLIYR